MNRTKFLIIRMNEIRYRIPSIELKKAYTTSVKEYERIMTKLSPVNEIDPNYKHQNINWKGLS